MNKFDIFSVPDNLDMTNPYKLNTLTAVDCVKQTFVSGMSLTANQWVWDTDERAYWIAPNVGANTRGYIRLADSGWLVQPGDDVFVEFDLKCVGTPNSSQDMGVRVDLLDSSLATVNYLNFFTKEYPTEWKTIKMQKRVPPSYANVTNFDIVMGVLTSAAQSGYSVKIRDVRVSVIRNSSPYLKTQGYELYGLGMPNLSDGALVENASTMPTTGARSTSLKSGFYGLYGATGNGGDGVLNGNGILIVLPYRSAGGTVYIEQIAIVNGSDGGKGIYARSYNASAWTNWEHLTNDYGTTANRPTSPRNGHMYYDYIIGKPIWWNGGGWKDATGTTV